MYRTADAEIARFPTYRAYLNVSITAQMISSDAISNPGVQGECYSKGRYGSSEEVFGQTIRKWLPFAV